MAVKTTSRPAARSAVAARSRAPRKAVTKTAGTKAAKTAAARTTKKAAKAAKPKVTKSGAAKPKVAKPKVAKVAKTKAAATTTVAAKAVVKAAVAARKKTVDATTRHEDVATLKVDPTDTAAIAIIARKRPATRPTRAGRRSAVDRLTDPPPATGTVLIERVSRAIERELTRIEAIIGGHHVNSAQRSEGERRARTLASLARTLREVMTLRAKDRKEKSEDDDAVPRDITALRLALARRLDGLVADAKAAHPESAE
jgi:hypothetical protein